MEKQKNIPVLRFSEFGDDWKKLTVSNICSIIGGGTPESGIDEYWNGNIQWFTPTEIKMDYVSKSIRTITELGLKKSSAKLLPSGSLLLTTRATIGEVAIALEECTTNQGFQSLIVNEGFNNVFIFNWIKTNKHEFLERANGSTFLEISKSEIEKISISTPTLPEQQKIASFFTAIDQKLTQLKKKKDLLEQYKKGVMQKIFSQEIRFKDDDLQEFPKWEKKKIKDLIEIKYGKDQKQISCENGKYPILGTGGEMGRTNDFLTDKPSVLIGRKGTIDKPRYMDTPFWTVDTLFYTKVFANTNPKWLYYKFETINWYLYNEASGVPSLSSSTIYTIPIILPTLPEQTKIAGFLSAIDMKISHTQKQIEKAEVWKKGLLQRMFV